jgi:hypothetical protein
MPSTAYDPGLLVDGGKATQLRRVTSRRIDTPVNAIAVVRRGPGRDVTSTPRPAASCALPF